MKKRNEWISRIEKEGKQMRMIDIHAHLSYTGKRKGEEKAELDFRRSQEIFTCLSAGTPEEWERLLPWMEREELLISFGLHPWYAQRYSVEACREYLECCAFVGEIGMDSVWCQVPLPIQRQVLERQLQTAADLGKPVLLHTKGQERAIGEVIRDFPGKICVHWYSGTEREMEPYLDKGCYFTLGPDVARVCGGDHGKAGERKAGCQVDCGGSVVDRCQTDREFWEKRAAYQRILREVPPNRLFVETDGISAVAWARNVETLEITEIPGVLGENMEYAAGWKGLSFGELERRMKQNLADFLA